MTLATHILIASAVVAPIAHSAPLPVVFAIALASHYLADTIPHYDYPLRSAKQERADVLHIELTPSPTNIGIDIGKVFLDLSIGMSILFLATAAQFLSESATPYLVAAFAACLPDGLQSVYLLWRKQPITATKKFHDFFHAKKRLKADWLGLGSQLAIVALSILLLTR